AIKAGHYTDTNPARDVDNLKPKKAGGFHHITMEELEQYEGHFPVGTMARKASDLILYGGGGRCSDAYRLGPQHIQRAGGLRYTQHKARTKRRMVVDIPILAPLQSSLDATPGGDLGFIISETGRPFASSASFGNKVKKWLVEAGLSHCSAHGFRKASACKLAEMGYSDIQIMAHNGWISLRQVQDYTREMRRKLIAKDAANEWAERQKSNESVPLSEGGAESGTIKVKKA
ncbi:MAG: integrase, partial [Rhodospirillaceae bacterium]|nr:integrase [Rhodospirillaceae bacterium]